MRVNLRSLREIPKQITLFLNEKLPNFVNQNYLKFSVLNCLLSLTLGISLILLTPRSSKDFRSLDFNL